MRVLIIPLNWGLGHATRCIPIVQRYLDDGAEVAIGGTGESLKLLQRYFPELKVYQLAPLELRYSSGKRQVLAMLRALPQLWRFARTNRRLVQQLTEREHFDLIISDNCFGAWSDRCDCVYVTHQLHIMLPRPWRWLEPVVSRMHARMYEKYKKVWVPDCAGEPNLSGALGHPKNIDQRVVYVGVWSRFKSVKEKLGSQKNEKHSSPKYDVVAIVSGLEPQRSIFENELRERFAHSGESFILYSGAADIPAEVLLSAKRIIARSGYSTIMDLYALGVLDKAELHPTPGQPEQEYLAKYHTNKKSA